MSEFPRKFVLLGTALVIALTALLWEAGPVAGQQTPETPSADSDDASEGIRGRLPTYYARLGLTEEQRTSIYKVQHDYEVQIEELVAKIIAMREERDREVRKVLTPLQAQQLELIEKQAELRREETRKKIEARDAAKQGGSKDE